MTNYALGEQAIRQLQADHRRLHNIVREMQAKERRGRQMDDVYFYHGKASGIITARAGATPGTGTFAIWKRNPTSGDMEDTLLTFDVYNWAGEIADAAFIGVSVDAYGDWWVTVEDCS